MHVTQLHALRNRVGATAGVELGIEISIGQTEMAAARALREPDDSSGRADRCRPANGRGSRTPATSRDTAPCFADASLGTDAAACGSSTDTRTSRARFANASRIGPCAVSIARAIRQPSEVVAPLRFDRTAGSAKKLFVEGFDVRGVACPQEAWSRAKLEESRSLRSQVPVRKEEEFD